MRGSIPDVQTIDSLRQQLRRIETTWRPAAGKRSLVSTGIEPLDRVLPEGGFRLGTLSEWLFEAEGDGTGSVVLHVVSRVTSLNGHFVVVDRKQEFHPPAAAAMGIDLQRTLIVQPKTHRDLLWSLEQALRCRGVVAVLGWIDEVRERVFRRLQLAAEAGGGLGLLLRPKRALKEPCWSDLRFAVEPVPGSGPSPERRVCLRLLYGRGRVSGGACELSIDDETPGHVRVVAPVAAPKTVPASTQAS